MHDRRGFLGLAAGTAGAAALSAGTARAAPPMSKGKRYADIYIKDFGKGRPVILSHGWPFNADSWDHHACVLADAGYRVISYDRRGFGRSTQSSDAYDYDTFADDLAQVIRSTGARDATLVGFSMGGGEVLRYMSRHRGKNIVKVGLVAAAVPYLTRAADNPGGLDAAAFQGIKDGLRDDRPKFLAGVIKDLIYDTSIASTHPVSQEVLDWSLQMALQAGLRGTIACVDTFAKTDFRRELAAIAVPTIILHGTADKAVPFELARSAAAGIRGARLVAYKGASHGILVSEKSRVAKDLLDFVAA